MKTKRATKRTENKKQGQHRRIKQVETKEQTHKRTNATKTQFETHEDKNQ